MDVLLVQQVTGPGIRPIVPLGLLSLATTLEAASHRVRVFDPNLEADWRSALRREVRESPPDLVGVSFRNLDSTLYLDRRNFFPGLRGLVQELRALCPTPALVLGGAGVAVFAEELLARLPQLDACVRGPGEESIRILADHPGRFDLVPGCLYRDPGASRPLVSRARRRLDFAGLPFPRRDFVPMERYLAHPNSVGVLTKQGCARQCMYCVYPQTSGRSVDVRDPEQVAEEFEYLARDFGVGHVYLADNQFNEPVSSMVELCETLVRRGSRMRWTAFFDCHRRNFDRDLLALVKRAGCVCVQATPEAWPQRYLDVFGKYREADVQDFVALFREEREVEALIDFFVDAPGQRFEDLLRLLAFVGLEILGAAWRRVPMTFKLHALRIYPGTEIFRKAVDQGYLSPHTDLLGEEELLDESLFYLRPSRKILYGLLLAASRIAGYRTPDYRRR